MSRNPFRLSESAFQTKILHVAKLAGWMVHHSRPAQLPSGRWVTPIAGDAGLPDLILVHPRRGFIMAEIKTELGRLTAGQKKWLSSLHDAGIEVYVWRPSMFDDIQNILTRKEAPQ